MDKIKESIKKFLIQIVPVSLKRAIALPYMQRIEKKEQVNKHAIQSFSQEGEDLILARFLEGKEKGFYIDIGAHHPTRFSNTYLLYLKGWRGLNIDAMPGGMRAFVEIRPEDYNIEASISDESKEIEYYIFKETALNTFNQELANSYIKSGWELEEKRTLFSKSLKELMEAYSIKRKIDVMTIDVEGFELNVLRSIDWSVCCPSIILIEDLKFNFNNANKSEIYSFMVAKQYELVAKTFNTTFFYKK